MTTQSGPITIEADEYLMELNAAHERGYREAKAGKTMSVPASLPPYVGGEAERLAKILHAEERHPDFEYDTTHGPRKAFDQHTPDGDGWEPNTERGRDGWERFAYHEEAYWRRRKPSQSISNCLPKEGE